MDKHELISIVKDLAISLGRTPTRVEFTNQVRGGDHHLRKLFGNYTVLLQAASLDPEEKSRLKGHGNEIFQRDLSAVLQEHVPLEPIAQAKTIPTLAIGDTHFPFVSERTLDLIYEYTNKEKPERIIQMGDLYDMYAHSKFPRSLNIYNPKQEEDLAREGSEKMWKTLKRIVPRAECIQLKGNHDIRPIKRTIESLPSLEHVVAKYLDDLMTFEGVKLISDSRQEYIVDGIAYLHGYRSKIGEHRDHMLMNAVCAHIHVGGTLFRRFRGQTFWELNAGFVGDAESKALGYTPQKIQNHTLGFGWIDENGPRFIPA